MDKDFFIEIDHRMIHETRSTISSDVCISKRGDGRSVMILSNGAGRGVKTNVIASTIASMALGYALRSDNVLRATRAIIDTFMQGDREIGAGYPSFTIISVEDDSSVVMVEFGNPALLLFREGKELNINKRRYTFKVGGNNKQPVIISSFKAMCEDRIVAVTDGVVKSGYATHRFPKGWGREGVMKMVMESLKEDAYISGVEIAQRVINMAETNDLFVARHDMCCGSIYLRKPRKVLICTGPPFSEANDRLMAESVATYDGKVIVSGGTTSQIISRELRREQTIIMKRDSSGLPPVSLIDGIDMVTEGVLTLNKVRNMLESITSTKITGYGTDAKFVKMLLSHDKIDFLVGTKINTLHHDPKLPVELELRRNVIKDIARLLREKFMKQVDVKFI